MVPLDNCARGSPQYTVSINTGNSDSVNRPERKLVDPSSKAAAVSPKAFLGKWIFILFLSRSELCASRQQQQQHRTTHSKEDMAAQLAGSTEAQPLIDSAITMFTNVFAGSSALFITLGLLILITRMLVRLGSSNYWGAFTKDQDTIILVVSGILGFVHVFLTLLYATNEAPELPNAPSYFWAVCWSMATLSGVCGGLGVGLVVFVIVTGGF